MSNGEDYDSDAPEEFTAEQGVQQDQELSKLQKEHKSRKLRILAQLISEAEDEVSYPAGDLEMAEEIEQDLIEAREKHNRKLYYEYRRLQDREKALQEDNNRLKRLLNRVVREAKERRRQWAQKKTPKKTQKPFAEVESVQDTSEPKANQESLGNGGMLPSNIVELLASREKQKFLSDSEDEKTDSKSTKKKKKLKCSRVDAIILKEAPAPQCLQNSLAFLEKRRMQVPRSSAVLNNSNQTLRLLSSSGLLSRK